jgi:signal peptidase I
LLLFGLVGVLGVYMFAVVNSYRSCRRSERFYEPRDFNRGLVYALFLLVGVSYPLGVLHYLRANYFEAFFIPTPSGVPNLLPGDRVLVNKVALRGKVPRRGDVVVFRRPNDRRLIYVKRVIGLPGDTIAIRSGRVMLNGKELERDRVPRAGLDAVVKPADGQVFSENNAGRRYLILQRPSSPTAGDYPQHEVPEDACFVLGDNRDHSEDSRKFGFVPLGDIVGVMQYNYWPAGTWTRFGAFRDY